MSSQEQDTTPVADEVVTSVRLPREQHDALRLRAEAEHRTLSGELRRVIALSLADQPVDDQQATA